MGRAKHPSLAACQLNWPGRPRRLQSLMRLLICPKPVRVTWTPEAKLACAGHAGHMAGLSILFCGCRIPYSCSRLVCVEVFGPQPVASSGDSGTIPPVPSLISVHSRR